MNSSIFRKYDIRGIYPDDLDSDTVRRLGRELGSMSDNGVVAVGRDVRHSGQDLLSWLAEGIGVSTGRVIDLGIQTTPMTYFAAKTLQPGVTVMITGSHNPPEYNGFKIMKGMHTVYGDEIQKLRYQMVEGGPVDDYPADPDMTTESIRGQYLRRLLSEFSLDRSLDVVVDGGNGTGGEITCEVLRKLGCRVTPLYCEMDGSFPNHHPDPTVVENLEDLRNTVTGQGSDLGIAFDGDADRLGVVDERGEVIYGDRILILLARNLLSRNPGATVISEVKASSLFFSEIESAGGRAVMSPTGHSIIKEAMIREDALLAGEMSGHIFFRDRYYGFDDALYAALRLLEVIAQSPQPLSHLLADLPKLCSTPEIREDCPEEQKFPLVDIVKRKMTDAGYEVIDIDGVRVEFENGWGLLRASNTQPVLVMRFEADSPDQLRSYESILREQISEARRELNDQGGS